MLSEDDTQMTQEDCSPADDSFAEEGHIEDSDEEQEVLWGRLVPLRGSDGGQHVDLTSAKDEYSIGRGVFYVRATTITHANDAFLTKGKSATFC